MRKRSPPPRPEKIVRADSLLTSSTTLTSRWSRCRISAVLGRSVSSAKSSAPNQRSAIDKKWLEELAPFDPSPQRYAHNRTGEDNADAHHKRQIMGREVVVAFTAGKLDFGRWEQIFYGEFDGRRAKRVLVKVIGE